MWNLLCHHLFQESDGVKAVEADGDCGEDIMRIATKWLLCVHLHALYIWYRQLHLWVDTRKT